VALLEHYVDLLVDSDRPDVTAQERIKFKVEARAKAGRDPSFAECSGRVKRNQFECAMGAAGVDRLEQCMLF
jgi:hypothetical protein